MIGTFSTLTSVAYIISIMMGSGINFMPAAFNNVGTFAALSILFMVACFTTFSIYALFRCASKYDGMTVTYANIAAKRSKFLKVVIDLVMVVSSIFTAIGFQKYIKELLHALTKSFVTNRSDRFYYHLDNLILILSTVILTVLALTKNPRLRKILPYLSVACVTTLMVVLMAFNLTLGPFISTHSLSTNNHTNLSFSLSFFIIAMSVQANMPGLFRNIKNKGKGNLLKIAAMGSACGFFFYGLAGFLGYRLIGNYIGTSDIIRIFLDRKSPLNVYLENSNSSKILIGLPYFVGIISTLILVAGFPLQLLPATEYFTGLIPIKNQMSPYYHRSIVLTEMLLITGINLIPNVPLDLVFGILGPTAVNLLSFFFPFLFYLLGKKRKFTFKGVLSILIMVACTVYFGYGSFTTLDSYFNPINNEIDFYSQLENNTGILGNPEALFIKTTDLISNNTNLLDNTTKLNNENLELLNY